MEPTGGKNAFLKYREQQACESRHHHHHRHRSNSKSSRGDANEDESKVVKGAEASEVAVLPPLVSQPPSSQPLLSPAVISSAERGDEAKQENRRGVKRSSDLGQPTNSTLPAEVGGATNGGGGGLSDDSSPASFNRQAPITSFAEAKELALARRQMIFVSRLGQKPQNKNGHSSNHNGNSHQNGSSHQQNNNGNSHQKQYEDRTVLEDPQVRSFINRNMIVWRPSKDLDDAEEERLLKRCFPWCESDAAVVEPASMRVRHVDLDRDPDVVLGQIRKCLGKIRIESLLLQSSKRQKLIDERNDAEISSSLAQGLRINNNAISRKRKPVAMPTSSTTTTNNHDGPRRKKPMISACDRNHNKSIVRRSSLVVNTSKLVGSGGSKPGCSKSPDVVDVPSSLQLLRNGGGGVKDREDYRFIIRTMNGTRCDATFPHNAKIKHLVEWMEERGFPSRRYELVALCPMRQLTTGLDPSVTLRQISLLHREVLHIRRNYHLDTSSSSSSSSSSSEDEDL